MRNNKAKEYKIKPNKKDAQYKEKTLKSSNPLDKAQIEKFLDPNNEAIKDDYDPEDDPEHIIDLDSELKDVEDLKAVDMVFLVDTTGSMNSFMSGVKRIMKKMIWDVFSNLTRYSLEEVEPFKFGLVTYKDHPQAGPNNAYALKKGIDEVAKIDMDLTSDKKMFDEAVKKMKFSGGQDEPEAVLDGMNEAINNVKWRDQSVKFLVHMLDAPAHGKDLNDCENDKFEECPCGLDYRDLLTEIRNKDIYYYIIKLSDSADKMIKEFEGNIRMECVEPIVKLDLNVDCSQN